jgi:hypothetical protein
MAETISPKGEVRIETRFLMDPRIRFWIYGDVYINSKLQSRVNTVEAEAAKSLQHLVV